MGSRRGGGGASDEEDSDAERGGGQTDSGADGGTKVCKGTYHVALEARLRYHGIRQLARAVHTREELAPDKIR